MSTNQTWTDGDMDESSERKHKDGDNKPSRLRHNTFTKRKQPAGFNGIHRRRNKRAAW